MYGHAGVSAVEFKETDESGANVYTMMLSNGQSYDIRAQRGPQGTQGIQGQTGPKGEKGEKGSNYFAETEEHAVLSAGRFRDGSTFVDSDGTGAQFRLDWSVH